MQHSALSTQHSALSTRVGLAGLGRMGSALAGRLLGAGLALTVWNRTPARAEPVLAAGAAWAETAADLAARCDVVLTSLTDDRAVEEVYLGERGLLAGARPDTLCVEMSTIRTATILRLAPLVAARGARLVDAPVSGTPEPARQGQLLVMVGGAAEDVERARPVLATFSRRIVHLGPTGAGTTMKLVLNMPMAIYWASLGEALAMGGRHGLSLEQMLDVILDSQVALPALRARAAVLLGAAHEVAFDLAGVHKDLRAMIANAQAAGVATPTADGALAEYAAALAAGHGARDFTFLMPFLMQAAAATTPPPDQSTPDSPAPATK